MNKKNLLGVLFCLLICNVLFCQSQKRLTYNYNGENLTRTFKFNEKGFCESISSLDGTKFYTLSEIGENWSSRYLMRRYFFLYPMPWQLRSHIEVHSTDGNIYTYPCGGIFTFNGKPKLSFYVKDKKVNESGYYDVHGRNFTAGQLYMNTISIKGNENSLKNCFHNLDWNNLAILLPQKAMVIDDYLSEEVISDVNLKKDDAILIYTVIFDKPIPKEKWDEAMQIKNAFPGFLPEEYLDNLYGSDKQAIISKINYSTMQVKNSVILPGLEYPTFVYNDYDNSIYCFEPSSSEPNRDTDWQCSISHEKPLYCINADDFSIRWVFTPREGEIIKGMEGYGLLYLFGSTTQHGYIGYENPMIIAIAPDDGKEYRWYYNTPRKGSFDVIKRFVINGEVDGNHIVFVSGHNTAEVINLEDLPRAGFTKK